MQRTILVNFHLFSSVGQFFTDFSQVRQEIEAETDRATGQNKGDSRVVIIHCVNEITHTSSSLHFLIPDTLPPSFHRHQSHSHQPSRLFPARSQPHPH